METVSSASERRMTVFGLPFVLVPQVFHAGHKSTRGRVTAVDVHDDCAATGNNFVFLQNTQSALACKNLRHLEKTKPYAKIAEFSSQGRSGSG